MSEKRRIGRFRAPTLLEVGISSVDRRLAAPWVGNLIFLRMEIEHEATEPNGTHPRRPPRVSTKRNGKFLFLAN